MTPNQPPSRVLDVAALRESLHQRLVLARGVLPVAQPVEESPAELSADSYDS